MPLTDVTNVMADIVFDFAVPIDYVALTALDIDEALSMRVYLDGTQVAWKSNTVFGDTAAERFEFGAVGGTQLFDRLVVDLKEGAQNNPAAAGPEFYDNLEFHLTAALPQPVPEPATLVCAAAAALALALVRGRASRA